MVHASSIVRRATHPPLAALLCAASLAGCHASSRPTFGAARASDVAMPAGAGVDPLAAAIEREPVRATPIAMPGGARVERPAISLEPTPIEPSWAEVPVVCERAYEVTVGFGIGLAFPGDQDLKFKRKNAAGDLIDNLQTSDVDEHPSLVESLDVNLWKTRGFLADFGLRASVIHWSTEVEAKSFVDGIPGGGTSPVPPFDTFDQDRLGVYLSLEKRFRLTCFDLPASGLPYFYLGLGAGYVYSDVSHGSASWATSAQAYAGFSLPVSERLRLRVEGLYLATRDADIEGANLDWEVETSGSATHVAHGHHYSHFDTRFLVAMLGVEYRL